MTEQTVEELIESIEKEWEGLSGQERLSRYFGLSYASWLTMPRVLMQQMPDEWQRRAAILFEEFDSEFPDWIDRQYFVTCKEGGKYTRLPEHLCNYRHPDMKKIDELRRK